MRDFAIRHGTMRLICSPDLTHDDVLAIQRGYDLRSVAEQAILTELDLVLAQPEGHSLVQILATLVAVRALEVRIALKSGGHGIFHHKIGIFTDGDGDQVSFVGSTNETWSGWNLAGNEESFEVFKSWTTPERVRSHRDFFDSVWAGSEPGIETLELPDAVRQKVITYAADNLADLPRFLTGVRLDATPLFPHQEQALADWLRNGRVGLLEHATGSGKTITALAAIRRWLTEGKPALVLVPSDLLLQQWRAECDRILGDLRPPTLLVGGGHARAEWEGSVAAFTVPREGARLTIATMQSATTEAFLRRVVDPAELLLVVDEVHRVGSQEFRKILSINAPGRLGLSATPERAGDPDGTSVILDYFVRKLEPPFALRDAIAAGRLVPYRYHFSWVPLSPAEQEEWDRLTTAIGREYARQGAEGAQAVPDRLKHLLIRRAAIVKSADAKSSVAVEVVQQSYREGQSWLVYCDSQKQLRVVITKLRKSGMPAFEYHSAMVSDRTATMGYFAERAGILVAIRCLDEGVDIPRVSHALILASSRNVREYVQRRGRVLRRHPGKHFADIFDILVKPSGTTDTDEDRFVAPELRRAIVFAKDALNRQPYVALTNEARRLGIELDGSPVGEEESDE